MTRLADRSFEMVLRNRVLFGVGSIERLPEVVAAAGGSRAFIVTDPGVRRAGVIDPILDRPGRLPALEPGCSPRSSRTRPPSTVERGAASPARLRPRRHGRGRRSAAARRWMRRRRSTSGRPTTSRSGSSNTTARTSRPAARSSPSRRPPAPAPRPTASRSSRTRSAAARTTSAIPSLLPVTTILDPGLTVGLPPAVTAATGIDAMTHSLESLLSANPNPFAEAMALGVIRTVGTWLRAGRRRRLGPRGALADADRLAPRGRRPGERDRRRTRPRAGPFDRDRAARSPTGPRSPPSCPRSCASTSARATASSPSSGSRSASRRAPNRNRPPRPSPSAPSTSSSATSTSVRPFAAWASPMTPPSTSSSPTPSTTPPSATRRASRRPWRRAPSSRLSPADRNLGEPPTPRLYSRGTEAGGRGLLE